MKEITHKIKCVVWDLDNTLWNGVLLEDKQIILNEEIAHIIKVLDKRGILHSIASRNDDKSTQKKLIELGLWEYFIYPEINWGDKSASIERIAKNINIGIDTLVFVDDQRFELDEVKTIHPTVSCFYPHEAHIFLEHEAFIPRFITNESTERRKYYQSDIKRKQDEPTGEVNIEFLKSLGLKLSIKRVCEEDLKRAEELTIRTHQLNTTGVTYSYEELYEYMHSDDHELLCCSLEDKYGPYGTIGLVLIEKKNTVWLIKLFLLSCRVMSRNIGGTLLAFLSQLATQERKLLQADFVQNEVNRLMYITYKFAGFEEIQRDLSSCLLELKDNTHLKIPNYIEIRSDFHVANQRAYT